MADISNICPHLDSTKSSSDKNCYRLVRLANGVEACLISNTDEQKQNAACACCVQVGCFSDPLDRCEGLAHYCEHMLFMGSKQYPGESEFEEFLSENGGYSNAYTECEYTCYYFEVNRKAFHKALHMFAQLFHEPLFTEDSSERELQAIESEFRKKCNNDSIRAETLFASLANVGHPWRIFGWGNLQSLREDLAQKNVNLHSELTQFFRSNYKSNRLRVCIFGIEDLDSLQSAVGQSFSVITPSGDIPQLSFQEFGLPIPVGTLPKIIRVRPVKDTHSLTLSWQAVPYLAHYLTKPVEYLSNLIGHEGRGSILSFLKDGGLATELTAGAGADNFSHSSNSMIFGVEVTLTELGVKQWPKVVEVVFQYIGMLRGLGEHLPSWPYDEQRLVAKMSFRFMQEKDPCDLAQDISTRMLPLYGYAPEHLLIGPWEYQEFPWCEIMNLLNALSATSCIFTLMSSSYGRASVVAESSDGSDEEKSEADDVQERPEEAPASLNLDPLFDTSGSNDGMLVEPRFGTEYWETQVDLSLLKAWEESPSDERLHLPEPNPFIATKFDLLLSDADQTVGTRFSKTSNFENFPVSAEPQVPIPRQHVQGNSKLWHLNCAERFKQPRSELWLKITSPYYAFDPRDVQKEVLLELYVKCLRDHLNETLYPASQAKLYASVSDASHGLSIKGGGFSQNLLLLVRHVIGEVKLKDYKQRSERRFEAQKEEMLRELKNAWLKPQAHCAQLRRLMLLPTSMRPQVKHTQLANLGYQDMADFVDGFWSSVGVDLLVMGNTSQEEVIPWAEEHITRHMQPQTQPVVELDVVRLDPGTVAILVERAVDSTQSNSALEIYWQLPGRDASYWEEDRTRLNVILHMLEDLMYEPLFDTLRTKEQLGYSVSCAVRDSDGVLGFSIYILSAVQRPPVLLERVESFLHDFGKQLRNLDRDKFASHAVALAGRWLEPLRTLSELQSTCWSEIIGDYPVFDRAEREAALLGTISLDEVSSMFDSYLAPEAAGRACIVIGVVPCPLVSSTGVAAEASLLHDKYRGPQGCVAKVVSSESEFHTHAKLHDPLRKL